MDIEFYERGGALLVRLDAEAAPRAGEYVNIDRQQWRVAYVAWAVDGAPFRKTLRANVELEKVPDTEVGPAEQKDGAA